LTGPATQAANATSPWTSLALDAAMSSGPQFPPFVPSPVAPVQAAAALPAAPSTVDQRTLDAIAKLRQAQNSVTGSPPPTAG